MWDATIMFCNFWMRPAWIHDSYLVIMFVTRWSHCKLCDANLEPNAKFIWKCRLPKHQVLSSDWTPRFTPRILTHLMVHKKVEDFRSRGTWPSLTFRLVLVLKALSFFLSLQSLELFSHLLQRSKIISIQNHFNGTTQGKATCIIEREP